MGLGHACCHSGSLRILLYLRTSLHEHPPVLHLMPGEPPCAAGVWALRRRWRQQQRGDSADKDAGLELALSRSSCTTTQGAAAGQRQSARCSAHSKACANSHARHARELLAGASALQDKEASISK